MNIFNYIALYLLVSIIILIVIDYSLNDNTYIFKYVSYGIIQTLFISVIIFIGTYKPQVVYKGGSSISSIQKLKEFLGKKSPSEKLVIVNNEINEAVKKSSEKLAESDKTTDRSKKMMLLSASQELMRKAVMLGNVLSEFQNEHHNDTKKRRSMHRDLLDKFRWRRPSQVDGEKLGTFTDHDTPERYLPDGTTNPHWDQHQSIINDDF